MKLRDFAMLLFLASIWGASFLFIRIAAPAFGPTPLVTLRVLLAGGALFVFLLATRQTLAVRGRLRQFLLLGLLNAVLPFTLIAVATIQLNAGFAAILNSTTPMFAAIIAAVWLKDQLTLKKIIGLALGIVGVMFVVGWSPFELTTPVILAIVASLVASFFYGLGSNYSKVTFQGVPPLTMALGQQLGAGVLLLPFAATNLPTQPIPSNAVFAAVALALVCTAFAYLLYFRLITNVGATNTTTVTMLVPFFSILWSAIFLGESIEIGQFVGLFIILAGLSLITGLRLWNNQPALTHPQPQVNAAKS